MKRSYLNTAVYRESRITDKDELVRYLITRCIQCGLPEPVREFYFHPVRKWRFDLAWLGGYRLLIDVQGGTWIQGHHSRGAGYRNDCIKMAEAVLAGYRVLWLTSDMIHDDTAIGLIERALKGKVTR